MKTDTKSYFEYLKQRSVYGYLYRNFWLYPVLSFFLKGRALDIGCGIGDMLRFRKNTVGVDISPETVKYCKELGMDAHLMDIDKIPFKNSSFDSVILDNVLEHIAEPHNILSEIHRVLKDEAIVIVGVPGEKGYSSDDDHKVFYDEEKLVATLKSVGLINKRILRMPLPFKSFSPKLKSYCIYGIFYKTNNMKSN